MLRYKNCSGSTYKFYDVVFHPFEVHEVVGAINHPKFVITDEPITKNENEETNEVSEDTSTQIPLIDNPTPKRSKKTKEVINNA